MQKSNKPIAGYHLLMILSAVDHEFSAGGGVKRQVPFCFLRRNKL